MASFPVPTYAAELGHGFPYELFTSHKVPKVCTACGTTRTPQWREGPEGPKTLCNACGVKRCRQLRLTSDGKRKPAARVPEAHVELEDEETLLADLPVQKLPCKAYAKGFSAWRAPDSDSRDTPAPSISGGTLGPAASSDSAEEEFWSPHGPATALPCSPTYAAIGTDSAAAINLLAMHFDPAAATQQDHSHGAVLPAKQGSHDSEGCSLPQAAEAGPAGAREPQQPRLHPNHQLLLELHELERQARVAEAAVPAVAQVLAQKQAVATQARFALVQCQKRARLLFESS